VPIGQLEPLYRYLTLRNQQDPVNALLQDMEELAKGKYIKNMSEGIHQVIDSAVIRAEIKQEVDKISNVAPVAFHQVSYQALGNKMYISINRVLQNASKTMLALTINEDDSVTIMYVDSDPFYAMALLKGTLYGSISTVIMKEDGTLSTGFLRCETSFCTDIHNNAYMKCDFRLSRTKPFYIRFLHLHDSNPTADMQVSPESWGTLWTR